MERNYLRRFNNSKIRAYVLIAVVLVTAVLLFVKFNPFVSGNTRSAAVSSKTALKDALKTLPLNREFKFPLKDEKNETIGEIKYTIENVELRDEIIIKGKKAYAVKGRVFLILNLKITNDSSKTISMNTKDYARLFVNGNEGEPLSPSIHNDPVVVDAISVKPTRIGFAISENDKDIKVKIGEIKGEKTTVDINF
jgi:hypothetical protein